MALEEVGTPCCNSSLEDDGLIPNYFHTGANKNFLKTKVRKSAEVCSATVLHLGKILHRNQQLRFLLPANIWLCVKTN